MTELNAKDRVRVIENRLVYIRELEVPTPESISDAARYVKELTKDWETFGIVVEFPSTVTPNAEVRHRVVEETRPLLSKLAHVAVITKANVFLKMNLKFIGISSGLSSISVHRDLNEAVNEARKRIATQ